VEYLVLHFPPEASSVQCSVNIIHFVPSEQKREALRSSSTPGSRGAQRSPRGPGDPRAGTKPSKYFLLERDNLLQSSEAIAEL